MFVIKGCNIDGILMSEPWFNTLVLFNIPAKNHLVSLKNDGDLTVKNGRFIIKGRNEQYQGIPQKTLV